MLAAVPRVMALLKTHLEANVPGLADLIATSQGRMGPLRRWIRFRKIHAAFGLKFWALISGGGALPGPLEQFWNLMGFVLVQGYGMTETTAIITLNHPFHVAQGTLGKPLAGREVKLGPDGEVLVRGASVSGATWSGGALHPRTSEWLATGDLAEAQPSGELRFLGRKSEVIVTAAGLNLHPEDLEAAIEQEPGVAACAVVPLETPAGVEPCAVLAFRGSAEQAAGAIEHANTRLAEFQRLRRWVIWPEPDLPRTSTGKVRRKVVAEWLSKSHGPQVPGISAGGGSMDWLLTLIAQITGENPAGDTDDLRLAEDLHLDSLGRVQLAAAIEERLDMVPQSGFLEEVQTLGQLRQLIAGNRISSQAEPQGSNSRVSERAAVVSPLLESGHAGVLSASTGLDQRAVNPDRPVAFVPAVAPTEPAETRYIYPRWPWWFPVRWLRAAFVELVMRPLVGLLAKPEVSVSGPIAAGDPMLIIANHITSFDGPLLEYALPGRVRRRMAVAMSGEMLEDFRHFRNPRARGGWRFLPQGPLYYVLVTALFNVFPLPRLRDFQRSFAHAGEALDHGFNVLVFPEGTRSESGRLARFRPGIGLLVKESGAAVLPMAMRGLGELKSRGRGWFRSGRLKLVVGELIRFSPLDSEAVITARLQAEVEKLLNG